MGFPAHLRINGSTRADRQRVLTALDHAVAASNGWIEDIHRFSNVSVVLNIEIPIRHVSELFEHLREATVLLDQHAEALEEECARGAAELEGTTLDEMVTGTVQITFFHHDPDLRIELPKVPG